MIINIPAAIFFICVIIVFYVYCGYPFLVFIIVFFVNRKVKKDKHEPNVTILIAAYNEEENIGKTLENKLNLDYPKQRLEIIVISDGSTDRTDEIVRQYQNSGVRLIRQDQRKGKTSALNLAVPQVKGEVIVFSDANSIYTTDALKYLVRNFKDPQVGYVTGKMVYITQDGSTISESCSTYMKYENILRRIETKLGSIVGVDGGIDAVRKELYKPMNSDQLPDFVLPLKIVEQGFRVIYEPRAILKEPSLKKPKEEYRMRVRVTLRALWAFSDMRYLLSFKRFKLFAWQLWSHKVLRYLCFIFLIGAYFSNLVLWKESDFYMLFFTLQNIIYLSAILSPILNKIGFRFHLFYLPYYFLLLNLASAHALIKFLLRQKQVIWTPRKG